MSFLGLDMKQADFALIEECKHSFDACWLANIIDNQAEFPRLRSEYDLGGLRARCPECSHEFNPFNLKMTKFARLEPLNFKK